MVGKMKRPPCIIPAPDGTWMLVAIDDYRILQCEKCRKPTRHEWVGMQYREYRYRDGNTLETVDASGVKEIWECKCGRTRIYGAPVISERKEEGLTTRAGVPVNTILG
jgi:hypothetical protein